jgi:hypothetical protein
MGLQPAQGDTGCEMADELGNLRTSYLRQATILMPRRRRKAEGMGDANETRRDKETRPSE